MEHKADLAVPVLGGLGGTVTGEAGCWCNFAGGKPRGEVPRERRGGRVPAGREFGDSECRQGSETLAAVGILQATGLGLCSVLQLLISHCSPLQHFPVHPPWAQHACFTLLASLQVNKKIRKWKRSLWGR